MEINHRGGGRGDKQKAVFRKEIFNSKSITINCDDGEISVEKPGHRWHNLTL